MFFYRVVILTYLLRFVVEVRIAMGEGMLGFLPFILYRLL